MRFLYSLITALNGLAIFTIAILVSEEAVADYLLDVAIVSSFLLFLPNVGMAITNKNLLKSGSHWLMLGIQIKIEVLCLVSSLVLLLLGIVQEYEYVVLAVCVSLTGSRCLQLYFFLRGDTGAFYVWGSIHYIQQFFGILLVLSDHLHVQGLFFIFFLWYAVVVYYILRSLGLHISHPNGAVRIAIAHYYARAGVVSLSNFFLHYFDRILIGLLLSPLSLFQYLLVRRGLALPASLFEALAQKNAILKVQSSRFILDFLIFFGQFLCFGAGLLAGSTSEPELSFDFVLGNISILLLCVAGNSALTYVSFLTNHFCSFSVMLFRQWLGAAILWVFLILLFFDYINVYQALMWRVGLLAFTFYERSENALEVFFGNSSTFARKK